MACYFCSSSEHLSENCNIYQTLYSRYEILEDCFIPCLCKKLDENEVPPCPCKNFCEVCLQKHHIALCPKRDSNHPLFSKQLPDSINLLNLGYQTIKRFLTLCNPIDKVKLHLTCKYLNQLQPLTHKLWCLDCDEQFRDSNTICIGGNTYFRSIKDILSSKSAVFNLEHVYIEQGESITKVEWKIITKCDPYFLNLSRTCDDDFAFCDILDTFPYSAELLFHRQMLPSTWISDLLNAKRYVPIRIVGINSPESFPDIDANELLKLFKANEKLTVYFSIYLIEEAETKIKEAMNHEKFFLNEDEDAWRIRFNIGGNKRKYLKYAVNLMDD